MWVTNCPWSPASISSFFKKNFWPSHTACGILVPRPGIKPVPPAMEAQSPNHWTARGSPKYFTFWHNYELEESDLHSPVVRMVTDSQRALALASRDPAALYLKLTVKASHQSSQGWWPTTSCLCCYWALQRPRPLPPAGWPHLPSQSQDSSCHSSNRALCPYQPKTGSQICQEGWQSWLVKKI